MWLKGPLLVSAYICSIHYHTTVEASLSANYTWNRRADYYFTDLGKKLSELFGKDCSSQYSLLPDSSIVVPKHSKTDLFVASFPVSKDVFHWWSNITPPISMRVDPWLCDVVYTKSRPIFKAMQCQLPHMMHPSAPRCQVSYLKWI